MTFAEFANRVGVSPQAVAKVAAAGRLDAAVTWTKRGKRRYGTITDVALAVELWRARPGAHVAPSAMAAPPPAAPPPGDGQPIPDGDPLANITTARLQYEGYRAKRERLEYEVAAGRLIDVEKAKGIFARQIQDAKTAIMALGKHARARIPSLTVDDVVTIEGLCREALEGLASGAIDQTDSTEGRT